MYRYLDIYLADLYLLGLDEAKIQYYIGHDIEDTYEKRNEFVNEGKLYRIKVKMDNRPIFNDGFTYKNANVIDEDAGSRAFSNTPQEKIRLFRGKGRKTILLQASAIEPREKLVIKIRSQGEDAMEGQCFSSFEPKDSKRTINIINQYHSLYKKALDLKESRNADRAER